MSKIYPLCLLLLIGQYAFAQLNVELVGNLSYNKLSVNDIWGYVAPDSTEYALVGTEEGVSIVSLKNPSTPQEVAFVKGANSGWRDLKTYGDYAYVTTEAKEGLQIIDLSNLPNQVEARIWETTLEGDVDTLNRCHNLYIDENGYCYVTGCNLIDGGFIILDVFSEPGQPKVVGTGPPIYSHDIFVRNNLAYSSEIWEGAMTVYDVTDKANVQLLASQPTPFQFTHNVWLSDDGKIAYTTDERSNAPTTAFDVSDLQDIKELYQFTPALHRGQGVIPHNVHVLNDYLVISHYGNGCVIVDAHRPDNLVEVANFDTTPDEIRGFIGTWGAYPFLPSGLVLMSDRAQGLFVLKPTYKRAAYLEGTITDATTNQAVSGVIVSILDFPTGSANSNILGTYKTGIPAEGTYEIKIEKWGYQSQTVTVDLASEMVTTLDIQLEVATPFTLKGLVLTDEAGMPIENAQVRLSSQFGVLDTMTTASGNFTVDSLFEGTYELLIGKWGYKTKLIRDLSIDETQNTFSISLEAGIEDPFVQDLGWKVENTSDFFSRIDVRDTFALGTPDIFRGFIEISSDVAGDIGNSCYATLSAGWYRLETTQLISPSFDVSEMANPTLSYYTTYANVLEPFDTVPGRDTFFVYLSNGMEEVIIEKIANDPDFDGRTLKNWRASTIAVNDFITPTANMSIRFVVGNFDSDVAWSQTKGGVDYFRVFDAQTVSTNDVYEKSLSFTVYPNPLQSTMIIEYEESEWGKETPQIIIYDALGRLVLQQKTSKHQLISIPNSWSSGLYFVQLKGEHKYSQMKTIVKK